MAVARTAGSGSASRPRAAAASPRWPATATARRRRGGISPSRPCTRPPRLKAQARRPMTPLAARPSAARSPTGRRSGDMPFMVIYSTSDGTLVPRAGRRHRRGRPLRRAPPQQGGHRGDPDLPDGGDQLRVPAVLQGRARDAGATDGTTDDRAAAEVVGSVPPPPVPPTSPASSTEPRPRRRGRRRCRRSRGAPRRRLADGDGDQPAPTAAGACSAADPASGHPSAWSISAAIASASRPITAAAPPRGR